VGPGDRQVKVWYGAGVQLLLSASSGDGLRRLKNAALNRSQKSVPRISRNNLSKHSDALPENGLKQPWLPRICFDAKRMFKEKTVSL
jgi:hypothetical protein